MPRPKKLRLLQFDPEVTYYKPRGVPLRFLKEVCLEPDEVEALKLHDYDNLPHLEAAAAMKTSQSTFARLLDSAYKKIAQAIVEGKAIRIEIKANN